jgi:hypothetical protein
MKMETPGDGDRWFSSLTPKSVDNSEERFDVDDVFERNLINSSVGIHSEPENSNFPHRKLKMVKGSVISIHIYPHKATRPVTR